MCMRIPSSAINLSRIYPSFLLSIPLFSLDSDNILADSIHLRSINLLSRLCDLLIHGIEI